MKKIITSFIVLLCIIVFVSCDETPLQVWGNKHRTQLVPIAHGYTLFSDQDIYGLLDGFGDVVWETEVEGARRARWVCIDDTYFIEGDTHLILRIDIEDGEILWGWRTPSGTAVWIVGKHRDNLLLAFDQYNDYDKNPVNLLTLSAKNSKTLWKVVATNYSGILNMPSPTHESNVLIVPTISGESVWIDGVSTIDGNHLWRVPWDFPPSGQPVILGENGDYFWCWKTTTNTYHVSTINKFTGEVTSSTESPIKEINSFIQIRDRIYFNFDSEIGYFDGNSEYHRINTDWMPLCDVAEFPEKLVAINPECHQIGILNTADWTIEAFKTVTMCHSGITGKMPGEFFLTPDYTPYENASFRYLIPNEKLEGMLERIIP